MEVNPPHCRTNKKYSIFAASYDMKNTHKKKYWYGLTGLRQQQKRFSFSNPNTTTLGGYTMKGASASQFRLEYDVPLLVRTRVVRNFRRLCSTTCSLHFGPQPFLHDDVWLELWSADFAPQRLAGILVSKPCPMTACGLHFGPQTLLRDDVWL